MTDSLTTVDTQRPELLVWSATKPEALAQARQALLDRLADSPGELATLAREQQSQQHDGYRGALVCANGEAAVTALRQGAVLEGRARAASRSVAFLLSGVGDQYPGMGSDLYATEPVYREAVDRCCALLATQGCDLSALLCRRVVPAQPLDLRAMVRAREVPHGPLATTRLSQPAVFVVEYALAELVRSWGVEPSAMIGYSLGEYVAACLSGVLSLSDSLRLVWWRANRIEELPPGGLLAVAVPRAEIAPWLTDGIELAAVTSPHQTVVGGPADAVAELEHRLIAAGIAVQRVGAHHAFHTSAMAPLAAELTEWVSGNIRPGKPHIPYLSNVTGTWITSAETTDPAYWARHLSQPVELMSGIGALWRDVDPMAIELGPGDGLTSYTRHHPACDRARLALVQPSLPKGQPELTALLTSLGRLWVAGLDLDWTRFAHSTRRNP